MLDRYSLSSCATMPAVKVAAVPVALTLIHSSKPDVYQPDFAGIIRSWWGTRVRSLLLGNLGWVLNYHFGASPVALDEALDAYLLPLEGFRSVGKLGAISTPDQGCEYLAWVRIVQIQECWLAPGAGRVLGAGYVPANRSVLPHVIDRFFGRYAGQGPGAGSPQDEQLYPPS